MNSRPRVGTATMKGTKGTSSYEQTKAWRVQVMQETMAIARAGSYRNPSGGDVFLPVGRMREGVRRSRIVDNAHVLQVGIQGTGGSSKAGIIAVGRGVRCPPCRPCRAGGLAVPGRRAGRAPTRRAARGRQPCETGRTWPPGAARATAASGRATPGTRTRTRTRVILL